MALMRSLAVSSAHLRSPLSILTARTAPLGATTCTDRRGEQARGPRGLRDGRDGTGIERLAVKMNAALADPVR